jgi:hypothetical protein
VPPPFVRQDVGRARFRAARQLALAMAIAMLELWFRSWSRETGVPEGCKSGGEDVELKPPAREPAMYANWTGGREPVLNSFSKDYSHVYLKLREAPSLRIRRRGAREGRALAMKDGWARLQGKLFR